jgi:hypothetical protein
MAVTFGDLQTGALGDDFDDTKYRARVKQAINDGLDKIARNAHLGSLEVSYSPTIVPGTASYLLPTNDVRIRSVFDTLQHVPLEEVDIEDIDLAAAKSGRPWCYAQYGGSIIFYPTPSTAYAVTVRYMQNVTALVNDTDPVSVAIPEEYGNMLISFARSRLFAWEDDPEMSAFWLAEWTRELSELRSDAQRRSLRRVRQVPGLFGNVRRPPFARP